jgi:signal transduction histidine kinase
VKLPLTQRWSSFALVAALAAILVVLGVMQYRWSQEVSEAASVRMQSSLHVALLGWRQDLYREFGSVAQALRPAGPHANDSEAQIASRYADWVRTAAHPKLVENIFVMHAAENGDRTLRRLDPASGQFRPASWPESSDDLQRWMTHASVMARHMREAGHMPGMGVGRGGPVMAGGPQRPRGMTQWMMAQDIPAIVSPMFPGPEAAGVDWIIVQFNKEALQKHIFPELAERYFGGNSLLGYRVAIVTAGAEHQILFSTDRDFPGSDLTLSDAAINVFGPPLATGPGRPNTFLPPLPARVEGDQHFFHVAGPAAFHFDTIHYDQASTDWLLVVRNRSGSLEAVAAKIRRRHLAVSFGVLLVLAATLGMIVVATQRAQRLAQLQMEFVAAVSHELRTPLTVISSAADNIADGVVDNKQQLRRYGTVIKNQARQLIHLVEQVLLFASTRDGAHRYHLQPLDVADVIHAALESTSGLITAAGFTVKQDIAIGLPQVEGDMIALTQCVQNLVTNAVKYGGTGRWVGIHAESATTETGTEVRISVSDRGPGVSREEMDRIFEPFYRGASATAAQIHGTGLGLALANTIAEAMRGRISVVTEPGKGSAFTLHLPATELKETEARVAAAGHRVS